jgi:hypothetical protein
MIFSTGKHLLQLEKNILSPVSNLPPPAKACQQITINQQPLLHLIMKKMISKS